MFSFGPKRSNIRPALFPSHYEVNHISELLSEDLSIYDGYQEYVHKSLNVILNNGDEIPLNEVLENFSNYDLDGADFSYCVLDNVVFSECNLNNVDFRFAYFKNVKFSGVNFNFVNFKGASFETSDIRQSCFVNCDFFVTSWFRSMVINSTVSNTNFYFYRINTLSFDSLQFNNVGMTRTDAHTRNFRVSNLDINYCDFSTMGVLIDDSLKKTNRLVGNGMDNSGLSFAGLEFDTSFLKNSNITGCDVSGVNFISDKLRGVINDYVYSTMPINLPEDYTTIKLDEFKYRILGPYMDFQEISFDGLLISNVSLYGCDLRNSSFNGTFFDGVVFTCCDFRGVDLRNAKFKDCVLSDIRHLPEYLPLGFDVQGDIEFEFSLIES
ncbi:hypothetical protein CL656_02595 [bacterium]|nr:hypothetical protein [bacterium]|tara:strand:+ start:3448 stop:4590 length:1143 start_codon:yes stop_codon:yes gene_type:complete